MDFIADRKKVTVTKETKARLITNSPQLSMNRCKLFYVFRNEDLITNLDPNLLSNILSCLPTKDVVKTSILSKGWRYKWTTSYNMAVKYERHASESRRFVMFMDRILDHSQSLESFRLDFKYYHEPRHLQSWISKALGHRLEVLEVQCHSSVTVDAVIPCSLLNSPCLRELILLVNKSTLNVAATNCAPKLTTLIIRGLRIKNENNNTSTAVKFDFPLLESVTFSNCISENVKSVELKAPMLRTFSSGLSSFVERVEVLASKLATFSCHSEFPPEINLDGSSIVSANIVCEGSFVDNHELFKKIGIRVGNLLNGFKNMEDLQLSTFIAEALRLGPQLQRHDKLRRLTFFHHIGVARMFHLLDATPSLKVLRLNMERCGDFNYEAMDTAVPSCLAHLEELVLSGFACQDLQFEMLKFFIVNGGNLKKLTMQVLSKLMQVQVKKFVSSLDQHVEIEFHDTTVFQCESIAGGGISY